MVTARREPRLIACTISANICPAPVRSRPHGPCPAPSPRARRACPSVFHSPNRIPTRRSAASAASTNRAGSRKVCASESPRSVGSVESTNANVGSTIARERSIIETAAANEPCVILFTPKSRITGPVLFTRIATLQPVLATATRMGQARASRLTGRKPTTMNPTSSRTSMTVALTGSLMRIAARISTTVTTHFTPAFSPPNQLFRSALGPKKSVFMRGFLPERPGRAHQG